MTTTFLAPVYLRVEIVRELRNFYALMFVLIMPVAMYLLFGAFAPYGGQSAGHASVAMMIAMSMGAHGAATAMATLGARASSEISQGWGRQLAMTPLSMGGYVVTKLLSALSLATVSVLAVVAVGLATGATAESPMIIVQSALIIVVGAPIYGLFGMALGMFLRPDAATAVAGVAVTFFSFFGNVFMPLDGVMLAIAHFTPMYGYVGLVRYAITGGVVGTSGTTDPVWMLVLNAAAWTVVFLGLTLVGIRRARARR